MRKRCLLGLITLMLISVVLPACQLLPAEENLPSVPVVQSYETKEYKYVTVARGDLVSSVTVGVSYQLTKKEDLSFPIGGLLIDPLTISSGQTVKKGDVLATLDMNSYQPQLDAQQYQINVLYKQREHLEQSLELELTHFDAMLKSLEQELQQLQTSEPTQKVQQQIEALQKQMESIEQRRASAQSTFDSKVKSIDDSIYLKLLQMEELEATGGGRWLVAGMDGVISYLRPMKSGQRSVKGERFITISDFDSAAFAAQTDHAEHFIVGSEVTVNCQGTSYKATVVEPEDLGLEVTEEQRAKMIYLKLKEPDPTLKERTSGTVELTLDSRSDVLYILHKAVRTTDGNTFVYVLDENNLRTMRNVTIGLKAGTLVEVISGLNEGDRVLVE